MQVFLLGFKKNIYDYMRKCDVLVMSSLWEEVGFVIVEAALCDTFVISSDCPNGPKEILGKKNGLLFQSNSEDDFIDKFNYLINLNDSQKKILRINAKKKIRNYSIFNHYQQLKKLLNN